MTKAELIRKIAKRTGVADIEAKYFFELFLKKLAIQLKPGESVKLRGIGYFQLRTGRIKNEDIHSELMIFFPIESDQGEISENMIFNIPVNNEPKFNPIDAFFSLSFGRPVIPLHNAGSSEYFLPPTGAELRRLSESKSEKLLREIELVENFTKGNEDLILNSDQPNDFQMEIDWEDIQIRTKDDPSSVSWDFGNLDKEIEEESLLDTGNEDNLIQNYEELEKESINWDFGGTSEEPELNKNKFEIVNTLTNDFNLNEEDEDWQLTEDKILKQTISDELNEDGFTEVKVSKNRFPFVTDLAEYEEDEQDLKTETSDSKKDVLLPPVPVNEEIDLPVEDIHAVEPIDDSAGYSKRKGLGFYLITAILFLIAVGFWGYTKIFKKPAPKQMIVQYVMPKIAPADVIIERNFDLPVTYPYMSDTTIRVPFNAYDLQKEEIKTKQEDIKQENISEPVKEQNQKPTVISKEESQVKEFVFKQGDKYIVQISAWQSKNRAEKHAQYLNEKGFTTEVQDAKLSGNTWYRVRAGYFNSLEEAEKFYNKYR